MVFFNLDHTDMEDDRTFHGGMPVILGVKYAINIWQRKMTESFKEFVADYNKTDIETKEL